MNRLVLRVTTGVVSIVLVSRGKSANKPPQGPSDDQRLAGYWRLNQPGGEPLVGVTAPRIMRLQVNKNGVRWADDCDLPAKFQGSNEYSLQGDVLTIRYYTTKPSPGAEEMLTVNENTFSGKVTRIDDQNLELDGKLKYVRFHPATAESLQDNASDLCK